MFPILAAFYRRKPEIASAFDKQYPQHAVGGGNPPRFSGTELAGRDQEFHKFWNWLFMMSNLPCLLNIDIVLAFVFEILKSTSSAQKAQSVHSKQETRKSLF